MDERDAQSNSPTCPDCGHRPSLHQGQGCKALLLGRGGPSRLCGCTTTAREILGSRFGRPPAELTERESPRY
jgi:hypothetical protein